MASRIATAEAASSTSDTLLQKVLDFLMRRRVALTALLFIVLLSEDFLERLAPHNLANLTDYKVLLGLALVLLGLGLRSWAAGTLHKRTELTTSGPYGLMRHPLYIGSFMMMLGFCALVDDAENIWFVVGPVLALYVYRALHEEKLLQAAFPDQWENYARRVSRFFPRHLPKEFFATWDLKQWIRNREYQAVSAVLFGLAALQMWHILDRP